MKYYDLKKYWRKVNLHLGDKELNDILVRDFNKFTWGFWRKKFVPGQLPTDFGWQLDHSGRRPAFWKYAAPPACHWLVNFALRLAMLTEPNRLWRIVSSSYHSTVWDGDETLFDLNFQAMGISPEKCFRKAFKRQLKPGEYLKVHLAQHWTHL